MAPIPALRPATAQRPLLDELKTLPGAGPDQVRRVAWRLGHALGDTVSVGFYITVLAQVVSGSAPVERLLAAYRAGLGGVGRNRAAQDRSSLGIGRIGSRRPSHPRSTAPSTIRLCHQNAAELIRPHRLRH